MDKKYEIIIFWSSEDNAYVAEVPELAGCMADGKTYQEALGNAEQIIEEWIETATKLGRPIPQSCVCLISDAGCTTKGWSRRRENSGFSGRYR